MPFLQHHGYNFLFVLTDSSDDPSVWAYLETELEPTRAAFSFTGWLRDTALRHVEFKPWSNEVCREMRLHRYKWIERKQRLDELDSQVAALRTEFEERMLHRDQQRGEISGPMEFQRLWNAEFKDSNLYRTFQNEGKRIPWGWVKPQDA